MPTTDTGHDISIAPPPATTEALMALSQLELLEEFNRVSDRPRRAKFDSKREAVQRIQSLIALRDDRAAEHLPPPVAPPMPDPPAPALAEATPKNAKRNPKNVRARQAELVIKVLVAMNPRRVGTDASKYFEAMLGDPTIREYLAKFPASDHRVARQWLWNTIRDGHVKTVGG